MKNISKYNWSNKSVLIVDDTYVNVLLLKAILEHTKIKITKASNSSEFFKAIQEQRYDIVLMDIHLGERLTGIDLIQYMDNKNIDTPVIIITAYGNSFFDSTIKYDYLISKPVNSGDLYEKMNEILTRK